MQNRLLSALPPADFERLLPRLEVVPLTLGQALDTESEVHFPLDCVIALLLEPVGGGAEISLVGNEGMTGIGVSFGGAPATTRAVVQAAGRAYRLRGDDLRAEFGSDVELQRVLFGYSRALLAQMAQTANCNRRHPLRQRLCRWLLLTLDRLPSNRLVLPRDLVARILGESVDEVERTAAGLQRLGAIDAGREHITVNNRAQLERLCCECYVLLKCESERLAPPAVHRMRSLI